MKAARFVDKVGKGLNEFKLHLKCEPCREIKKEDIGSKPQESRAKSSRSELEWELA